MRRYITINHRGDVVPLALVVTVVAVLLGTAPLLVEKETRHVPIDVGPYVKAENAGATLYNLAVFFTLLVAATVLIYLIFTRRRLLNVFLYFVWYILTTGVIQFYAVLYYWSGIIDETTAIRSITASFIIGGVVVYLIYKRRGDLLLGLLGALAGVMFVWILPEMTVVALLVALPIYDYVMVSRGLLGKLVKKSKEATGGAGGGDTPLFGFVVRLKSISLGVGDFVVYAMALSYIFMKIVGHSRELAFFALGAGAVLIYLGFILTVEVFLKRWGYGPALPFPILALAPLIAAAWLL